MKEGFGGHNDSLQHLSEGLPCGNVNLIVSVVSEGMTMTNGGKLQGVEFIITKSILTTGSSAMKIDAP